MTPPAGRDPGFPVVLKAPAIGRAQPALAIVSFEMEQMILPVLSGPHVPRFVAVGDLSATPYVAMEWIDGESLAAIVERAPLPIAEVVRIGAALADAVNSIHAQDVVHLDLKPENFILRANGEAVLLDFGYAHHARYPDLLAEEQHFAAGSAPYVSPEQLRNDRSDPRSDLFALGVLLYELATGAAAFRRARPRTRACATGCGARPRRRAASIAGVRRGCRRSSCAAWSPTPLRAISPPRIWRSTCGIPTRCR